MSHITTVKAQIKSLSALKKACEKLGLTLCEGVKKYFAYSDRKCDHKIKVTNNSQAYEVGLTENEDGTYSLNYDFYGNHGAAIQKIVGTNCDKLMASYTTEAVVEQAEEFCSNNTGWHCEEPEVNDQNEIYVRIVQY